MEKITLKKLQTELTELKTNCPELTGIKLELSDSRIGKYIELVKTIESGAIQPVTGYMSFDSMYYYLRGYSDKSLGRFRP